jgi:chemotaxis protein CheX
MFEADLINPFLEAAYEIFASVVETEVNKSAACASISSMTSQEVNVLINIVGSTNGQIIYGMPLSTAKHIASKMIGQPVKTLNAMAQSAIGELGNMITGSATTKIEERYPDVELRPPIIVIGEKMLISTEDTKRINVSLTSDLGIVEVGIAFFEKKIVNKINIIHHGKACREQII